MKTEKALEPVSSPDLAKAINNEHEACMKSGVNAIEHAFETGRLLEQAKATRDPSEDWTQWVEKHLTFDPRQARSYMRIWRHKDAILAHRNSCSGAGLFGALRALTSLKREEREGKREARRAKNKSLIDEMESIEDLLKAGVRFATIALDPPWDWGDEGDCDQLGRARPTYKTMPIEELEALPVGQLADEDCHLYLWITNRSLPKGFALLDAWGFRYVTCLTWCKPSFGMGNYFRGQTEHILFGVKGSQSLLRKDAGTVFHAKRGPQGHSSKPVEFYALVETCSPGPHLEMFARSKRDGWTAWGAEA